ncbi:hypothetical protein SAMN04487970_102218 [Paenibacillus tianmuensis]|uniref:Uncharacterized protein n=1 Tax=Paenibacillus tianmuensis TaxID=624147 RepID=A0A1G4S2B6_9BACL|nr:hypothetical protein SAMN04487970_102218 [Paenibacillus tianmuensis]
MDRMYQKQNELRLPAGWQLSPRSVLTFITGRQVGGVNIT